MLVKTFYGVGYPSSSREIVKLTYGKNDPNGYYLIFELDPQCSIFEIKTKYRELVKKYHPDGSHPNPDKFREIKEIYNTLSNHNKRIEYNNIDENSNLFFMGELEKERLRTEAFRRQVPLDMLITDTGSPSNKTKSREKSDLYTYVADSSDKALTAQQWYSALLQAAYLYQYQGPLRVAVCPLDELYKITNTSNYLIFWFDSELEPNWAIAILAFSLFRKLLPWSTSGDTPEQV